MTTNFKIIEKENSFQIISTTLEGKKLLTHYKSRGKSMYYNVQCHDILYPTYRLAKETACNMDNVIAIGQGKMWLAI